MKRNHAVIWRVTTNQVDYLYGTSRDILTTIQALVSRWKADGLSWNWKREGSKIILYRYGKKLAPITTTVEVI